MRRWKHWTSGRVSRYRLGFPELRTIPPRRPDRGGRKDEIRDYPKRVPRIWSLWRCTSICFRLGQVDADLQMYTANTMASAIEALGMCLPGSSSFPAEYPEKLAEADSVGETMKNLLEKNLLPRDIMTREAFENAMVCVTDFLSLRSQLRP